MGMGEVAQRLGYGCGWGLAGLLWLLACSGTAPTSKRAAPSGSARDGGGAPVPPIEPGRGGVTDGGAPGSPYDGGPPPSGDPLSLAVFGSAVKVRPERLADGGTSALLVAARNEFESFQIAVSAPDKALSGVTMSLAGPLLGPGGATLPEANITVYREAYYTVVTPSDLEGAPGRWPDPLIPTLDTLVGEPRNAFPVDVPQGENRVAWLDLRVPLDAPPGLYRGRVDVKADGHGGTVPVELEVIDYTLPSTTTLKSVFELDVQHGCVELGLSGCSDVDTAAGARDLYVRMALDNRMTLASPHAAEIDTAAGKAAFLKHDFPFIHGTADTRLSGARLTTYQVNHLNAAALPSWRAEAQDAGIEDIAFAYSCDEPHFFPIHGDYANNWKICESRVAEDTAAWPEVPKLITTHIQSVETYASPRLMDIIVINVELLDGPAGSPWFFGNQRPLYNDFLVEDPNRTKELWLYTACGSHGCTDNDKPYTTGWAGYDIDAPASETRAMAWLAFRYDLTGTLYYDTVWQLDTAWETQYLYTGNGEGTLFYPGTPGRIGGTTPIPVESLRMKLVRDGYEDYELLHFLSTHGNDAEAQHIAKDLFPGPFATAQTDGAVQAAHRALAERVKKVVAGR